VRQGTSDTQGRRTASPAARIITTTINAMMRIGVQFTPSRVVVVLVDVLVEPPVVVTAVAAVVAAARAVGATVLAPDVGAGDCAATVNAANMNAPRTSGATISGRLRWITVTLLSI
jgi:hypothetical protein